MAGNVAPPANWQTNAFSDAAWPHPVGNPGDAALVWPERPGLDLAEQALFRGHFNMPAAVTVLTAQLQMDGDCRLLAVYLNGAALAVPTGVDINTLITLSFSPALFILGADNVLAVWAEASATSLTPTTPDVQYVVTYTT